MPRRNARTKEGPAEPMPGRLPKAAQKPQDNRVDAPSKNGTKKRRLHALQPSLLLNQDLNLGPSD